MSKTQDLWVLDVGACSPLGFCAASTAAAAWAGVSRMATPDVPVRGTTFSVIQAACPLFDADTALVERLASLAHVALTPMLAALAAWPGCLTIFVALPAHAASAAVASQVMHHLQHSLKGLRRGGHRTLSLRPLTTHPGDFAHSLQAAARYLAAPTTPELCIVGGVDSNLSPCRLQALSASGALYERETGEGMMPGEAAGFLTVSLNQAINARPVLAQLNLWHQASPGQGATAEAGCSAAALQRHVEQLLHQGASPALWVSDATGEGWRARAQVQLATSPHLGSLEDTDMLEPARLMGDTGVAYAPLACAMALYGIQQGLVHTHQSLLTAQDAHRGTAWLLTARPLRTTALTCEGPWSYPPKRAF